MTLSRLPATAEHPPLHRLQGLDRSHLGAAHLYLASNVALPPAPAPLPPLAPGQWLGSGTFRNSLYLAPWRLHAGLQSLWLALQVQGALRVRIMLATPGAPAQTLVETTVEQDGPGWCCWPLPPPDTLPAASRLFWHVEALGPCAGLQDAWWCTATPPRRSIRLATLLRTHGRSAAVQDLLRQWQDQAAGHPALAATLGSLDLWVLDSSEDAPAQWDGVDTRGLGLRLWHAPNLGGGGNASHLLQRYLAAHEAGEPDAQAEELLLLDDDLQLSLESLARYAAFLHWRQGEQVWTLPVLMKSRPTTVWEDGAYWGRQSPLQDPRHRGLGPHLLRHGLRLDDFGPLDDFSVLHPVDYATFIFFGLSLATLRRIGLPAALLLRGDDVELSLRAGAQGVPVLSSPNLAAWHEPAHSHAQEYLAVLHGMLLNLAHARTPAADHVRWFEQRLLAHGPLGDLAGLAVYQQVLDDLCEGETSALLTPDFMAHYPARLARLRQARWTALGPGDRERLHVQHHTGQLQLRPYLYPAPLPLPEGGSALLPEAPRVLLLDESRDSVHEPAHDDSVRLQHLQAYLHRLAQFNRDHEALRQHWRQRLRASGEPAFWADMARRLESRTQLLRQQTRDRAAMLAHAPTLPSRTRPALGPLAPALAAVPASATASRAARSADAAPRDDGENRPEGRSLLAWLRRPSERRGATVTRLDLPEDFDPQVYLALHADVARAGVDPRRHYLQYGRAEGRRYRV
ncbi:hypothetical protein [Ideonella livida]|uniref:Glycosyltransferase family 2 protein n=1 Tax=Ideonella livida TaxID=2707176 RepID=A0A7C9PKB1_9BURK|nr:hypothetical protein [Ideonella livida]NDY93190.1 hypothetical protein [Ideonella livida]